MNRFSRLFTVVISFGIVISATAYFIYPDETDVLRYRTLIASTAEGAVATDKPTKTFVAKQQRNGVSKEIYFENEQRQRLHLTITSDTSDIIVDQTFGKSQVYEKLHHVICCMQEEIFYKTSDGRDVEKSEDGRLVLRGIPREKQEFLAINDADLVPQQIVRYIEADEALYNFHTQTLVATHSKVARYLMKGHQLPSSYDHEAPTMEGTASKVTVSIVANRVNFNASELKAKLYSPKNLP